MRISAESCWNLEPCTFCWEMFNSENRGIAIAAHLLLSHNSLGFFLFSSASGLALCGLNNFSDIIPKSQCNVMSHAIINALCFLKIALQSLELRSKQLSKEGSSSWKVPVWAQLMVLVLSCSMLIFCPCSCTQNMSTEPFLHSSYLYG